MKSTSMFTLAVLFTALPASTFAQDAEGIVTCGRIANDVDRLACFDGLVARATRTDEERRADAIKEARENFGLRRETRQEQAERLQIEAEVASPIVGLSYTGHNRTVLLENGQLWEITSSDILGQLLKTGQVVTISDGALSGYRLRVEGKNGKVTVRRLR